MIDPFLSITVEHLSYLTQAIYIWIFEYLVQAVSDLLLNTLTILYTLNQTAKLRGEAFYLREG
jgi:hypothetical protein